MPFLNTSMPNPLTEDCNGILRVNGTRVTLDTIVEAFTDGATAEAIAHQYPTLDLADIYQVISYYLRNGNEVRTYLDRRRAAALVVQRENEARWEPAGVRERLLARVRSGRGGQQTESDDMPVRD